VIRGVFVAHALTQKFLEAARITTGTTLTWQKKSVDKDICNIADPYHTSTFSGVFPKLKVEKLLHNTIEGNLILRFRTATGERCHGGKKIPKEFASA